jgi:O-antigen ligase
MLEPALFPSAAPARAISRPVLLGFISVVVVLVLLGLNDRSPYLFAAIAGIVAPVVLFYGVTFTARHHDWLIFPLALMFLLIDISLLNEQLRSGFHYATLVFFCLPALPSVWRSGVLRTGVFRLYLIFFLWAAVTVSYSLVPIYSFARLMDAALVMIALVACVLEIRQPEDVTRLLLRFLMACGVILIMSAVAFVVMPHSTAWQTPQESYTPDQLADLLKMGKSVSGIDRFRGLLDNPNDLGSLMLIVIGTVIASWRDAARRERMLMAAMVAATVVFDVLADSRSAFVAIAVGGALYMMWKWGLRGVLLFAGGLALAAVIMMNTGLSAYVGRGDVTTLTGRTDMWAFVIQQIREHPILGYGYEVSGAVFESKYFPLWWGPWDLGPHSSLHNGYLTHAIGVGIPATALWLYIILRPWVFVLRQKEDPWNLKPMFFFIVIPILIGNFSEQLLGDFGGAIVACLFGLVWAIAERYRLLTLRKIETERKITRAALPKAVSALASA